MERDRETESAREMERKREERNGERTERAEKEKCGEEACMQNNAYQFRITLESPRLVHTWYL